MEKFDTQSRIKISSSEWEQIRSEIFNAFFLESLDNKNKLKNACEKRVYNGTHITFYTKNVLAQNFVIRIINENLKIPGIKARGPR